MSHQDALGWLSFSILELCHFALASASIIHLLLHHYNFFFNVPYWSVRLFRSEVASLTFIKLRGCFKGVPTRKARTASGWQVNLRLLTKVGGICVGVGEVPTTWFDTPFSNLWTSPILYWGGLRDARGLVGIRLAVFVSILPNTCIKKRSKAFAIKHKLIWGLLFGRPPEISSSMEFVTLQS